MVGRKKFCFICNIPCSLKRACSHAYFHNYKFSFKIKRKMAFVATLSSRVLCGWRRFLTYYLIISNTQPSTSIQVSQHVTAAVASHSSVTVFQARGTWVPSEMQAIDRKGLALASVPSL